MAKAYFSNEEFKNIRIADPFVLKTKDKGYYLYGTTRPDGFSYLHSDDLVHWSAKKVCYRKGENSWCQKSFWAPEVVFYEEKYYMFYSARNQNGSLRIGLALSNRPEGMFEDIANEPLFDFGYAVIDANVLIDEDGRKYLYYSRDCSEHEVGGKKTSEIYGICLKDDLTGVWGKPVKLLTPVQDWERVSANRLWNEAPEIIKHEGKYYLSYSANYFASADYAVGYAVSDAPLGPFVKAGENPILTSKGRGDVFGPGHHSFTRSPDGTQIWVAYHSLMDPLNPLKGRRLNIDRAGFSGDGRLYIEGPTTGRQPAPA